MIHLEKLDAENESTLVADATADLPDAITDRNPSEPSVKLNEAGGAFYGALSYYLDTLSGRTVEAILELFGYEAKAEAKATVTLDFTAKSGKFAEIPAGTVVKTGTGDDAVAYETDADATTPIGGTTSVDATAVEAGDDSNVAAETLTELEADISEVKSVTNPKAATNGRDRETAGELVERVIAADEPDHPSDRLVTTADVDAYTLDTFDDVERAKTRSDRGAFTSHIVLGDLNETPDTSRQDAIESDLQELLAAGHVSLVHQPTVRLVQIVEVEVEYASSDDQSATDTRIEEAVADHVSALEPERGGDAWPHGARLYLNNLVDLVDDTKGVERVGRLFYQTSDDYGSTWSTKAELTGSVAAGVIGGGSGDAPTIGLLHHATGHKNTSLNYTGHDGFTVTEL